MAIASDYAIARFGKTGDEPLSLTQAGDNPSFTFDVPQNADLTKRSPGILWYMVHSTGSVAQIKVDVSINGKAVTSYGPTSTDLTRPFHEIVGHDANDVAILKKGTNTVTFKYVSGVGTFKVSDIIVFFKVQV